VNDLFITLGIESWKPWLTALLLPPVPLLLLTLAGTWRLATGRRWAWTLVLAGLAGLWATSTTLVAAPLQRWLLQPPSALAAADIAALRRTGSDVPKTTIVVLGGGLYRIAPEYGGSTLRHYSIERLRYGLWLARETGLGVGYSGGVGHGARPGISEAEIAQRMVEREYGRKLAWAEGESRDTHENAVRTLALLEPQGVQRIVLVTSGFHMRRAVAAFERAAQRAGRPITIVPAPMGLAPLSARWDTGWMPSAEGLEMTRVALHEWLGRLAGA
jgi:uncharacterized SAM-binding protein YcdF (DUF218 family)